MKKKIVIYILLLTVLSSCIGTNNDDYGKIENEELLYVNGNQRENILIVDQLELINGSKTIFLINAECPKCLLPFLESIDTIQYLKNDIFVFSVYQYYDFFCDLISEKTNQNIPYYIDKNNTFYDHIMECKESDEGVVQLAKDIIVRVNPKKYKIY